MLILKKYDYEKRSCLAKSLAETAFVRAISQNPEAAFDYTSKNLVAVLSNGSGNLRSET